VVDQSRSGPRLATADSRPPVLPHVQESAYRISHHVWTPSDAGEPAHRISCRRGLGKGACRGTEDDGRLLAFLPCRLLHILITSPSMVICPTFRSGAAILIFSSRIRRRLGDMSCWRASPLTLPSPLTHAWSGGRRQPVPHSGNEPGMSPVTGQGRVPDGKGFAPAPPEFLQSAPEHDFIRRSPGGCGRCSTEGQPICVCFAIHRGMVRRL
jgi:hypothetical protein